MSLKEAQAQYRAEVEKLDAGKRRLEELEARREELADLKHSADEKVETTREKAEAVKKGWVAGTATRKEFSALQADIRTLEEEREDLGALLSAIEEEIRVASAVRTLEVQKPLHTAESNVFKAVSEMEVAAVRTAAGRQMVRAYVAHCRGSVRGHVSFEDFVKGALGDLVPRDHGEVLEELRAEFLE